MTSTSPRRRLWFASLVAAAPLLFPAVAFPQMAQTPPPASEPPVAEPPPAEPPPTPPPPPPAEPVTTSNKGKLTFKGFVSATMFAQDTPFIFGDGQNAEFPTPAAAKGDDPWFLDGDVRNTRINLTWEGPTGTVLPRLGAVVEVDFFAPGGGGGSAGNAQPVPRLRLAFVDLGIGRTTLRIGQDWAPLFAIPAASLSHIGFPLGYGSAGMIGWRFPGLTWSIPLTAKDAALGVKVTLAVLRNTFPAAPNLNPPNQGSTGIPQLEGRLDLNGKAGTTTWNVWAVGHFDAKDLTLRGEGMPNAKQSLTAYAFEAGTKVVAGPFSLLANGYFGKAIGHQFGNLFQFGDIAGWGAYGQVGFDITPNWSVFVFAGTDQPDHDDVIAAVPVAGDTAAGALPRLKNLQAAGMLRYKIGPYSLGLEYLFDKLDFVANMMGTEDDIAGNQIAFSVNYAF